jgi:hypothetical protein
MAVVGIRTANMNGFFAGLDKRNQVDRGGG